MIEFKYARIVFTAVDTRVRSKVHSDVEFISLLVPQRIDIPAELMLFCIAAIVCPAVCILAWFAI